MPSCPSLPGAITMSKPPSERTTRSAVTISRLSGIVEPHLTGCGRRANQLSGSRLLAQRGSFLDGHINISHHVEGLLRQVVVLAFEDLFETANRLGDRHEL